MHAKLACENAETPINSNTESPPLRSPTCHSTLSVLFWGQQSRPGSRPPGNNPRRRPSYLPCSVPSSRTPAGQPRGPGPPGPAPWGPGSSPWDREDQDQGDGSSGGWEAVVPLSGGKGGGAPRREGQGGVGVGRGGGEGWSPGPSNYSELKTKSSTPLCTFLSSPGWFNRKGPSTPPFSFSLSAFLSSDAHLRLLLLPSRSV